MRDLENLLIQAVQEKIFAEEPRLVYADWLEEQGDELRAEYLRQEVDYARRRPDELFVEGKPPLVSPKLNDETSWRSVRNVGQRLANLASKISAGWLSAIGRPMDLVLCTWGERKLHSVKSFIQLRRTSLACSKLLVEDSPVVVLAGLPFGKAWRLMLEKEESLHRMEVAAHDSVKPRGAPLWIVQAGGALPFVVELSIYPNGDQPVQHDRLLVRDMHPLIAVQEPMRLWCTNGIEEIDWLRMNEAGMPYGLTEAAGALEEFGLPDTSVRRPKNTLVPCSDLLDREKQVDIIRRVSLLPEHLNFVFMRDGVDMEREKGRTTAYPRT